MNETLVIDSAKGIKETFGDRICIYAVLIGNDEAGRKLMKEISEIGSCGFATDADSIFSAPDMADFSRKVFLGGHVKSWTLTGIEFEFASAAITPDSHSILDKAVKVLKENPSVKVSIEGHTDNIGSGSYNQTLSENRAKAVMNYFIKKGISEDRLSSVGYGYTRPVASNETAEGRSKNRRVELITIK
jgi:OOP family OmpA-OmpF porin